MAQGVNDKGDDCDADAGIGDVEGWPRVGEANVQIEEKKIGDVTVDNSVGEVAHNAGEKQREGEIAPGIFVILFSQEKGNDCDQSDARQQDKEHVIVFEGTESRPGIGDIHQIEPARNDRDLGFGIDVMQNPILADLIERIERQ